MTPTRLAYLLAPALPLAPVLLALAACGGEAGESGRILAMHPGEGGGPADHRLDGKP